IKAGSCAGFKNQKGINAKTIEIGNSSDISGPVPGLFSAAQQATQAYVAYFNATSNICGRKLHLNLLDSKTDAGADQQSYTKMCEQDFASVGSMSAFDSGGAGTAQSCGLPDMRTASVTAARNACSTCFGAQATGPHEFSNAVPDFIVKNYKSASQKAAFLYLNAGAAAENAKYQQKVEQQRGMKFLYSSGIEVSDFNYGPYVQQMKSKGVQYVQFIGAYQQSVRLAQAMQSADFHPTVRMYDPSVYDQNFLKTGGSAIEGAFMFINFTPLEESQPELNLYKKWLQQVSPGAQPTFFGEFAWSAAKLFVQNAIALGGKLNRASLAASFKPVHAWTGGGMHGPMDVGGKHSPSCIRFLQVKGGRFVPLGPTKYTCNGSSVGR
ncbi:MAG: ABC transporter substrate-binding protein, partial [Marmoricola sp.]